MYIRHDVSIDHPVHAVRRELLEPPERWLPASCVPQGDRRYHARVGFTAAHARITKQVELTVGEAKATGDWLVVPVAWRATGPAQLFPALDGKLTVQPLGRHSCRLWMGASYQPPLAGLGHEIDDVAMHRVASATVEDFVESVGAQLSQLAARRPA